MSVVKITKQILNYYSREKDIHGRETETDRSLDLRMLLMRKYLSTYSYLFLTFRFIHKNIENGIENLVRKLGV